MKFFGLPRSENRRSDELDEAIAQENKIRKKDVNISFIRWQRAWRLDPHLKFTSPDSAAPLEMFSQWEYDEMERLLDEKLAKYAAK